MRRLIVQNRHAELDQPRLGGGALLDKNMPWPRDPKDNPMLMLASVPARFLPDFEFAPDDIYCSFFAAFDLNDYDHLVWMADSYKHHEHGSCIIIHKKSVSERNEGPDILKGTKLITLDEKLDEETNWVQDEIIVPGMRYLFELSGYAIEDAFPGNRGIWRDGVGYFFISDRLNLSDNAGFILLQDT